MRESVFFVARLASSWIILRSGTIPLKICLCLTWPAITAWLTPSALNVLINFPSWPSDIQCTVFACCSISGKVSSLIAATTMSIPRLRAASSTRNGNFPLPAIRPYLLDDSTIRRLDEIQNDFDFRSHRLTAYGVHGLAGVQFRSQEQTKRGGDVSNLF